MRKLSDCENASYSFVLPGAASDHRLTTAHLRLLILVGRVNRGWLDASQKWMAERLGLKSRTVNDAIRDLVEWGYLRIRRQAETHSATCHYRVNSGDDHVPVIAGTSLPDAPAITGAGSGNDRNRLRPRPEPLEPAIIKNARASDQSDQEIKYSSDAHDVSGQENRSKTDKGVCYTLPFSKPVIDEVAALGIDPGRLIEQYSARTMGRNIKNPSAYLLGMARDEVAKRDGVTAEQVKKSTSRDRSARMEAAVEATCAFSVPSAAAMDLARRRKRQHIDVVVANFSGRNFRTQKECDQAFERALENARFRPPGDRPRLRDLDT